MSWSPLQRGALEAMGFALMQPRAKRSPPGSPLRQTDLPARMRGGLERWVGGMWGDWPTPEGRPGDAAFKRALWRRVRDWRRGG